MLDHNLIFAPYFASEDADTLDAIFRDKEVQLQRMVISAEIEYFWLILQPALVSQWLHNGKGLMAHKLSRYTRLAATWPNRVS